MRPAKAKATAKEASEREKTSLTPKADLGETPIWLTWERLREDEGGPDPISTRPNFDFDPRR